MRKGLDVLAEASPRMLDESPRLHLAIVGERYSSKPEAWAFEQSLHNTFDRPPCQGRVHWLGVRDDVSRLLRGADMLLHPARQEPFGRVLLEAAATGLPIVATHVGGTPELLIDRKSAWLIAAGAPEELAQAVTTLNQDLDLRARLGGNARLRVESRFAIETAAVQLEAHWRDVTDRSSSVTVMPAGH
jgi:glycosyltransferase involved in cell wall biosynthesis